MSYVWEHSKQSGSALLLLLAMADHAHDDGRGVFPSVERLAKKCRSSERNTRYLLRSLEAAGELIMEPNAGPNRTNLWQIPMSEGANFAPCNPLPPGQPSVTEGAKEAQGGATEPHLGGNGLPPNHQEPSLLTVKEPSLLSTRWQTILAQDKRWTKFTVDEVHDIEASFAGLDLTIQAHKAYDWLQGPKGLKKKRLKSVWIHWLETAKQSMGGPPNGTSTHNPDKYDLEAQRFELSGAAARLHKLSGLQ